MFSNLFGNKSEEDQLFKDRAFMTTAAKMQACVQLAKHDESAIFISWFSDTTKRFKTFFTEKGIDPNRVVEASEFPVSKLSTYKPVFLEHYPLHKREKEFVQTWNHQNILVYSAMDEPLFKHFGSEKLLPMMKMLGMKEDVVIEHSMVSKSILKGQQKIEEMVQVDQPAFSQAEWMQKNLK